MIYNPDKYLWERGWQILYLYIFGKEVIYYTNKYLWESGWQMFINIFEKENDIFECYIIIA